MRLSASIVLLRRQPTNSSDSFKILFVQRSENISSPGLFTFPGGVYEKLSDSSCLKTTALRELFEETGILFGMPIKANNTSKHHQQLDEKSIQLERHNLHNNSISFETFLNKYDLDLDKQKKSLKHFTTFITPDFASPKFVTSFFIKDISDDERCCDFMKEDATETASLEWLTPSEAMHENDAGRIKYLPPQAYIISVEWSQDYGCCDD